ncbi:hypothetical protein E4P82_01675 [Candidatus Competibacter phosphatis]|uniref:Uncharacterized protein n=1 Tax=Candidatus Competibacter phosphatis TaxID=221280 RepID=A0ABX1TIJ8_9GAMM|nr:hypothetical protein [Candidatus Competibacter phosphatis]NMQ18018.1 hypothetical protein [Candidatus Competibacter phosphatis]
MLVLEMKRPDFKEGAYGVVFFTSDGRATKVFRRRTDASEEHVESVFQSEVCAYKLATSDANLRCLIPEFFGCVSVERITNAAGCDVSSQFFLHRAYQMQRIEGDFVKLGTLLESIRQPVIDNFRSAGIRHTCDVSVIVKNGAVTSVIDFATQKFVLEHQPL